MAISEIATENSEIGVKGRTGIYAEIYFFKVENLHKH